MADIAIFRINYKSDFIITLESDAGWATPFCIKFWTDSPQRAFYVQYDGETYTHCAPVAGEPTKLMVQMDDHHLGVGNLKYQIAYHFTVADFPNDTEDEVLNQAAVIINEDGQQEQVMLDLNGETAPEIAFSLPAYANEQQRIENEEQRIANEQQRIANEEQRINKEQQRISNEEARVTEFARLKRESEEATQDANDAAVLATTAADLASAKAQLAQDAATLANQKAQLAADKAALAAAAADLATAKAQLAQEKATYAQAQGDYAKAQGDYAKSEGDAVKTLNTQMTANEQTRQQNEQARQAAEQQRVTEFEQQMASQQSAYETAEANRESAFETAEERRDAEVDEKVADITQLQQTTAQHTQQIAELSNSKQAVISDLASIAIGSGISSDDTYTAARTATIPNFILLTGATVKVLFTTPVNAENTTLNVNSTGAKPLHILGQQLPAGVIKAQTYAEVVYNGTAWNIVNVFCPDASFAPAALVVDMGLPSGVKWAARDIDLTKPSGFCDTPFTYMKSFFSWGNIDGHNPISNSQFDYNWGGSNAQEPWYEGQVYGETKGNTLTANIAVGEEYDCARANLGTPWRMPTSAEFVELFQNIIYINADGTEVDTTKTDKRVTVNGVLGLYIQSKINGARLFFSCSGYGENTTLKNLAKHGTFLSCTHYNALSALTLYIFQSGVNYRSADPRSRGVAVRAVQ